MALASERRFTCHSAVSKWYRFSLIVQSTCVFCATMYLVLECVLCLQNTYAVPVREKSVMLIVFMIRKEIF